MSGRFGRAARRWFRSSRVRRGYAAGEAGVERLEGRVLLTAGDVRWNQVVDFSSSGNDGFLDVAVQADGKIVAVGYARSAGNEDFLIARFTAAGQLDRSFAFGGTRTHSFAAGRDDAAYGVVIQPDGKIVVVGKTIDTTTAAAGVGLLRLNGDGSIDGTFAAPVLAGESLSGDPIALTADGGVVVGTHKFTNRTVSTVYKFNASGGLDNGFNGTGSRELPSYVQRGVRGVAAGVVGGIERIVAVTSDGYVAALTTAGAFDDRFSGDGITSVGFDAGASPVVMAVALMPDGRVVVGGDSDDGGNQKIGVARLRADGTYDNTFDGNGRYSFDPVAGQDDYLEDLAVLPNGAVVLVGNGHTSISDGFIAVVGPGGVLDGAFAGDGAATWIQGAVDDYAETISGVAVTAAGHFVLAGALYQHTGGNPDDALSAITLYEGRYGRRDDLLGWTGTGDWYAAGSTGGAFGTSYFGTWNRNAGWKVVETADLNGDGRLDVLGRDGTGQWWIGFNTGTAFATVKGAKWNENAGWRDLRLADFDGDGRADVAARTSTGQWWVSLSTGTGLANGVLWSKWNEAAQWRDVLVGDFNGDGRADIAGRSSRGEWYVARAQGATSFLSRYDVWSEGAGWRDVVAGDFNGDGRDDIAGRTGAGQWWVGISGGGSFTKSLWGTWGANAGWADVGIGDFDRNGSLDIAGRASNGQWYVAFSDGTRLVTAAWGKWNPGAGWRDVTIGDYDGDGRADFAGRTSTGEWYVTRWVNFEIVTARWGKWNEGAGWMTFGGELVPTA